MKRNLFLLSLTSLLLIIIYFQYEKPEQSEAIHKESSLLNYSDLGELNSFQTKSTRITFHDGRPYVGEADDQHFADPKTVDMFLNYLKNLHHKKVIKEGDRNDYIKNNDFQLIFNFEQENLIFTLGEKLSFSAEYYMEVKRGNKSIIVLVSDKNIPEGVYQKEDSHNHDLNYRQILSLISMDKTFFEDKRIFRKREEIDIISTTLINFRGASFSINFKDLTTSPSVPSQLSLNVNSIKILTHSLKNLRAKKIITEYHPQKLSQRLAQMKVELKDQSMLELSLYNKYLDKPGYYIVNSEDKMLFSLERSHCEFFFQRLHDYWNLKFLDKISTPFEIEGESFSKDNPKIHPLKKMLTSQGIKWWQGDLNKENYKYLYQVKVNNEVYKLYHRAEEILITMDGTSGPLYYKDKNFPLKVSEFKRE